MRNQNPTKPVNQRTGIARQYSPVGKNAASVTPPAYGIGLVDNGSLDTASTSGPLELQGDLEEEVLPQKSIIQGYSIENSASVQTQPAPLPPDLQVAPQSEELTITPQTPFSLQSAGGNRAYGDILQAKLAVGAPNDHYEQEADRVADQVMRMPDFEVKSQTKDRELIQTKGAPGAASVQTGSAESAISGLGGGGSPLPASERAFFEPRFGQKFSNVRIHTGPAADNATRALNARAFTLGRDIAFAGGEYSPGSPDGRRLLAHELTHTVQQQSNPDSRRIQRALKLEFQVKRNKIFGWDGGNSVWTLPRKFGPADFIHKGSSGVRMESETGGQVEFETGWERKWPKLQAQVTEAAKMTGEISDPKNDVTINGATFKKLPFDIGHLRRGGWKVPKGKKFEDNSKPGHMDRALKPAQNLVVQVSDPDWNAYIQTSESMLLTQYESYMRENEFDRFDPSTPKTDATGKTVKDRKARKATPFKIVDKVTSLTDSILAATNTAKLPDSEIANLRGYLQLVIHYIIRGQFPAASPIAGAGKYTFALMSRTHLGSVYTDVLSTKEKALFRKFVGKADSLLLGALGLNKDSKFFVHGQGTVSNPVNPKITAWLDGLQNGRDALSSRDSPGRISAASGRFKVGEETGKHKGLMRFETRMTPGNNKIASKWPDFAFWRFYFAMVMRPRPNGKGETGLQP